MARTRGNALSPTPPVKASGLGSPWLRRMPLRRPLSCCHDRRDVLMTGIPPFLDAPMVELRELYGMKVFDCAPLRATITPATCAANYLSCKRTLCTECPIGAEHAGRTVPPKISWRLCCRCGRTDQRLIRGQICVSCYNREREVLVGRNAKGAPPVHARPLRAADVFVAGVGMIHVDRVADVAEAIVLALRRHPGAMVRPLPPA